MFNQWLSAFSVKTQIKWGGSAAKYVLPCSVKRALYPSWGCDDINLYFSITFLFTFVKRIEWKLEKLEA